MKCFSCNSDMIPGIMPGSLGWCKAECDIDNESATITVDNLPYALPVTLWWNSDSKNTTFTVLTDHSYTFDAPGSYPPSHDDVRRLSAESPMGKVWIKYINGDHTHVWRSPGVLT